jgi:hypothetical protein
MQYAILCYDSEAVVHGWTKEQDDAVMTDLEAVQSKLRKEGRLGPVARLAPTKKAVTLRKGREAMLMDGPFAETKEQLLGFYVVDCESIEEAAAIARDLGAASGTKGAYEIRPLIYFAANGSAR